MVSIPEFRNDVAEDRIALIEALQAAGLPAFEWEAEDGQAHVSVMLLDAAVSPAIIASSDRELKPRLEQFCSAAMDAFLCIASTGAGKDSAVVLIGEHDDPGAPFESSAGGRVASLQAAVAEFERLWNERDHWLWQFLKGYAA